MRSQFIEIEFVPVKGRNCDLGDMLREFAPHIVTLCNVKNDELGAPAQAIIVRRVAKEVVDSGHMEEPSHECNPGVCPDCERPSQFGEVCESCRAARDQDNLAISDLRQLNICPICGSGDPGSCNHESMEDQQTRNQ